MGLHLSPHLEQLLATTVQGLGYVYVGAESVSNPAPSLRIYIEGPNNTNISLGEITVVSRQLGALLEVEVPAAGHYRLEVSSPGMDRRLFQLADYQRFVGQEVKIRLHRPYEGRRNWSGELLEASDEGVKIKVEGQIYSLDFANIEKANLVPQYKW